MRLGFFFLALRQMVLMESRATRRKVDLCALCKGLRDRFEPRAATASRSSIASYGYSIRSLRDVQLESFKL